MVKNSVSCECAMRSRIFEIIGNRETGLKLVALVGSPLLYTGVIFASCMDNGNLPSESDLLKMRVTDGAKTKGPSGVTDCLKKTKSFSIFQPPPTHPPTHPPLLQVKRIPIKH